MTTEPDHRYPSELSGMAMYADKRLNEGSGRLNPGHPSAGHSDVGAPRQNLLPPSHGRFPPPIRSTPREYSIPSQRPTSIGNGADGSGEVQSGPSLQPMDALSRLQTQAKYDTARLATQRRDFDNLVRAVGRLSERMIETDSLVLTLRKGLEHLTTSTAPAREAPVCCNSNRILESLADSIGKLSSKVSEIDALRMQLDITRRRVDIMEQATPSVRSSFDSTAQVRPEGSVAPPPWGGHQTYPSHQVRHTSHAGNAHPPPPLQHRGPSPHAPTGVSTRTPLPDTRIYHLSQLGRGYDSPSFETTKRQRSDGVDSPMDGRSEMRGSTKRPKLLEGVLGSAQMNFEVDEGGPRDDQTEAVGRQQQPVAATPAAFIQFMSGEPCHSEADGPPTPHDAPPSGKVPMFGKENDRGGRARSLPADFRGLGEPRWKTFRPRSLGCRRVEVEGIGIEASRDSITVINQARGNIPDAKKSYSRSGKMKRKPTRNADGVLVRKDGMPDMRSQRKRMNDL